MSLLAQHGVLLSAGQIAQAVWDSGLKDSSITLSNGDRDAAANGNNAGIALSTTPKTSGKFYVELEMVALAGAGQSEAFAAGIRGSTASLNNYLGQDSDGFGNWVDGASATGRSTYNNGVQSNVLTSQPTPTVGYRMRMAVDVGVGVWFSRWNGTSWIGGGDPAAGTSPTYALSPGTYRLAANPRGTSRSLRLVLPVNWNFPPPVGFDVWG